MAKEIAPSHLSKYLAPLKSISIPALLIWGNNDRIVPLENGHRLNRDLATPSYTSSKLVDICLKRSALMQLLRQLRRF